MKKHRRNNAVEKVENVISKNENNQQGEREIQIAQDKEHQKAERQKQKASEKRYRQSLKRERNKQKKGIGGWLTAVITLGATTLALAIALTCFSLTPSQSDKMLENAYRRAYYDAITQVDNIDLNLSKAISTSDEKAVQKYLLDLSINCELAESDVGELPLHDESKFYTTKLINQIGDFSKYLNKKIIDGEGLTREDYETLERLQEHNLELKNSLKSITENIGEDFSFREFASGKDSKIVLDNLSELQNLSANYPQLIYDGPFSDGRDGLEIKGLKKEEVSEGYAEQQFKAIFAGYNLDKVESVGIAEGNIACYNVQGTKDKEVLFAQISKNEGKLIMFAYSGSCNETKIEKDQAIDTGLKFLESLEIEDMTAVWVNLANNVYTINYAYEQEGIIVYADLIKVRVCAETNMVIGLEAVGYYTNHQEREINKVKLTKEQAMEKVSSNIDIETSRLALVKIGEKTEKLTYEFSGTYKGSTYYVYIDAISGYQVEMFKVVEGTEGELLM